MALFPDYSLYKVVKIIYNPFRVVLNLKKKGKKWSRPKSYPIKSIIADSYQ